MIYISVTWNDLAWLGKSPMVKNMDISGMDKARILVALFNRARAQGLGLPQSFSFKLTVEMAQQAIKDGDMKFDYIGGRSLKVDLSGNTLDTRSYNRDNGQNAAEMAIADAFRGE